MSAKRFFFIVTLLLVCLLFTRVQTDGKNLQEKIKVIMDDNYPPYTFRDNNGNLQGIAVDQWEIWEKKTGIQVEIDAMDWNLALETAKNGDFDVIDTAFRNPEREQFLTFGKPYADIKVSIFFQKNITGITGIESLKGFEIGVKKGDNCIRLLQQKGIQNYVEFSNYESIVKAAKNYRIMVYVMDEPPAMFYLYKMGIQNKFKSSSPLYSGRLHRAVKRGNLQLLNIIQSGFDRISNREYKAINNRWMGTSYNNRKVLVIFEIGILVASCIAIVLLIWSFTLQRMVNHKTKELRAMVQAVGEREKKLAALLNAIPDTVFVMDKKGTYLECYAKDDAFSLHHPLNSIVHKSVWELLPEKSAANIIETIEKVLENKEIQIIEYSVEVNAEVRYLESRMVLYEEENIMQIVRDITDKKSAELEIYEMSVRDGLTGLYNRNYFESKFNEIEWEEKSNIAMVLCDLDGLKIINDTMGHDVGDLCLKTVATELSRNFRESDLVTRIGGDEFAVVMKNTTAKEIDAIRQKLRKSLRTVKIKNMELPISVSMGYSIADNPGKNQKLIFKEADDYMYREKLHQQLSVKSKIVTVLLRMLEARDFATEGHCERLQDLAAKLAARIGQSEQEINDIILLAQFHDIGKVGISDAILFKPGKLSPLEYAEMKRHSEIGYRIASALPDLVHIADWIYKHHEWWNGLGYPLGLRGHDIPVQCRILSIVDAFDAMTSDRPYRKALSIDEALQELLRCAGNQFDPEFVEYFIEMLKDDSSSYMAQGIS